MWVTIVENPALLLSSPSCYLRRLESERCHSAALPVVTKTEQSRVEGCGVWTQSDEMLRRVHEQTGLFTSLLTKSLLWSHSLLLSRPAHGGPQKTLSKHYKSRSHAFLNVIYWFNFILQTSVNSARNSSWDVSQKELFWFSVKPWKTLIRAKMINHLVNHHKLIINLQLLIIKPLF